MAKTKVYQKPNIQREEGEDFFSGQFSISLWVNFVSKASKVVALATTPNWGEVVEVMVLDPKLL